VLIGKRNYNVTLGLNRKKILCVANLRLVKGIEFLIRAMKSITEKIPEAKLLLIGEGPDKPHLINLVKELGV